MEMLTLLPLFIRFWDFILIGKKNNEIAEQSDSKVTLPNFSEKVAKEIILYCIIH